MTHKPNTGDELAKAVTDGAGRIVPEYTRKVNEILEIAKRVEGEVIDPDNFKHVFSAIIAVLYGDELTDR
jgi:hypothetical protein